MRLRLAAALSAVALFSISTPAPAGAWIHQPGANPALFRANWKSDAARWQAGGGKWTVSGALLTNTADDSSTFLAPYRLTRSTYAVEATIRLVAWRYSGTSEDNVFGILFRGANQGAANPATGLVAGVARGFLGCDGVYSWAGIASADTDAEVLKETSKFRPAHGWHMYRLEVRGNQMRLLVDGTLRNTVTSKRFSSARALGLYALAARVQVRDFRVGVEAQVRLEVGSASTVSGCLN